jgi:hypothetical protein
LYYWWLDLKGEQHTGMQSSFDPHEVWERIEWEAARTNHPGADSIPGATA